MMDDLSDAANSGRHVSATRAADRYLSTEIRPALPKDPRGRSEPAVTGMALRSIALVQALAKLDRVSHLQLVMAATRSMLELLVDVVLLTMEADPLEMAEKLEAWELSARYKVAQNTVRFKKNHRELTELEQPLVEFIEQQGDRVDSLRRKYWLNTKGKGRHPNRWTGGNLLEAIRRADELTPYGLEDFYHEEYGRMNFQVHGSSLAGQRGLDIVAFRVWFCMGHRRTCEFAFLVAERSMSFLGILNANRARQLEAAKTEWQMRVTGFAL